MAWLTNWSYRKPIVIAHTADGAQTNYQMKLLVGESAGAAGEQVDCGGLVASDFDDLRFTKADGTTLLDYWIESLSGATPNQLATIWIEVPNIAAHPDDTTIYMYYGGTQTAVSSGAATFIAFNSGNTLTGWTVQNNNGAPSWATSFGKIRATINTVGTGIDGYLYCDTQTGVDNYRVVATMQASVGKSNLNLLEGFGNVVTKAANLYGFVGWQDYSTVRKFILVNSAGTFYYSAQDLNWDMSAVHQLMLLKAGNLRTLYSDNVSKLSNSEAWNPRYVGLYAGNYEISQNYYVDFWNIFIANYTPNEPTWGSFGAQELAIFTITTTDVIVIVPSLGTKRFFKPLVDIIITASGIVTTFTIHTTESYSKQISDVVNLADTINFWLNLTYFRAAVDSVVITPILAKLTDLHKLITNSISLAGSISSIWSKTGSYTRDMIDSMDLDDTFDKIVMKPISEIITVTGTFLSRIWKVVTDVVWVAATLNASSTPYAPVNTIKSIFDQLSIAEAIAKTYPTVTKKAISDVISLVASILGVQDIDDRTTKEVDMRLSVDQEIDMLLSTEGGGDL